MPDKNKHRNHVCPLCGYKTLNIYYGVKSFDGIPIYLVEFYDLYKDRCFYCGKEYWYLTKKEV